MKMAKFKLWMVALTLMMGVSLTSCFESDPTVTNSGVGQVTSILPLAITNANGVRFNAINSLGDVSLSYNDYVYFVYSYNSDEQVVNSETKSLEVTISGAIKVANSYAYQTTDKGESLENATITGLAANSYPFVYYNKTTLLVPIYYLAKEKTAEHSFHLVYDESEIESNSTELKFYLRHQSNEEKPKQVVIDPYNYTIFNIQDALRTFSNKTSKSPKKIVIYANESKVADSDSLEDKKDELTAYTVEYPFKDE